MSMDEPSPQSAIELFDSCAYCNAGFDHDVRYPVTVREDDDGELQIRSFCDPSCQDAWEREH